MWIASSSQDPLSSAHRIRMESWSWSQPNCYVNNAKRKRLSAHFIECMHPVTSWKRVLSSCPSSRWFAAALIGVAIVGLGTVTARYAVLHSRRQAVRQLSELLRSERPEVRQAAADRLRDAGTAGIAPLVQALLDERQVVFDLTSETIDRALVEWQFLSARESHERLVTLAGELEACVKRLPAQRRFVARRWAEQIALRSSNARSSDTADLLANCETVLRQSTIQGEVAARPPSRPAANSSRRPATVSAIDLSAIEPNAFRDAQSPPQTSLPDSTIVDSTGSRPARAPTERASPGTKQASPSREPHRLVAPTAQPITERRPAIADTPASRPAAKPAETEPNLSRLGDFEVMRKLHELRANLSEAAEKELRRRGYRTVDLPICQALTNPDPAIRLKLAEALPSLHSVNPRPWLLQLSQDENADVRQAAESILRTSGHPAMRRQLR